MQNPSDHQQKRQTLAELHAEFEKFETLDDGEREMVRHLIGDLQEMLDRSTQEDAPPLQPDPSSLDRMQQSVDVLELTHPTLTAAIRKALAVLNIAGI